MQSRLVHHRVLLRLGLICAFVAVSPACSDPGSGPGSGTYIDPCVANPQLFQCWGAADGSGTADAGAEDTAGCVGSAPRCGSDTTVEDCVDGVFQTVETCASGTRCSGGACVPDGCSPVCQGRQCGDDGCGGSCGTCPAGQSCGSEGQCSGATCSPDCAGKQCGSDGCGGSCGACGAGYFCNDVGQCALGTCSPDCLGKECGSDGCGGSCGNCPSGWACTGSVCEQSTCTPDCAGKQCGSDGCGGVCGTCPAGQSCVGSLCQAPPTTGGNNCSDILSCLIDCTDVACENACLEAGSTEGLNELDTFLA